MTHAEISETKATVFRAFFSLMNGTINGPVETNYRFSEK